MSSARSISRRRAAAAAAEQEANEQQFVIDNLAAVGQRKKAGPSKKKKAASNKKRGNSRSRAALIQDDDDMPMAIARAPSKKKVKAGSKKSTTSLNNDADNDEPMSSEELFHGYFGWAARIRAQSVVPLNDHDLIAQWRSLSLKQRQQQVRDTTLYANRFSNRVIGDGEGDGADDVQIGAGADTPSFNLTMMW